MKRIMMMRAMTSFCFILAAGSALFWLLVVVVFYAPRKWCVGVGWDGSLVVVVVVLERSFGRRRDLTPVDVLVRLRCVLEPVVWLVCRSRGGRFNSMLSDG